MALVLDAGALIAIEKGSPAVLGLLVEAQRASVPVRVPSAVVAQVWRNGARQARLASVLRGVDEVELTRPGARRIGELLGASRRVDVVDGSVIDVAQDGDEILTSDPGDLRALAGSIARRLTIITV